MDTARLAYLSRYLFLFLLFWAAYRLLLFSRKQLRARMKLRSAPLAGYFLYLRPDPALRPELLPKEVRIRGEGSQTLYRLPLYPTTVLGKGRSADLRFLLPGLERRAAVLYRYEEAWYLRPAGKGLLEVNGDPVTTVRRLSSRDQIQMAGLQLTFVDERLETERAGRVYDERLADWESGHQAALARAAQNEEEMVELADILTQRGPWTPCFTLNLFILLSGFLMYLLFPSSDVERMKDILKFPAIIAILLNLYLFVFRFLSPHFDRNTYLGFAQLLVLGNTVQYRLAFVNRSQILAAAAEGDWETHSQLLDYVSRDFRMQEIALCLGLLLLPLIYVLLCRSRLVERLVPVCLLLTPLLYLLTMILGRDPGGSHGARLWIHLGGLSLQLTEFAKLTYLVVLAGFFKIRPRFKTQLAFGIWAALIVFMIMLLPDLGSVMVLIPTTLVVYVIMTSAYLEAGILAAAGTGMSVIAYLLFPHVRARISGWQSLWTEITPRNEQIVFGLQAVARGGLLGRGIGNGSPAGIPEASGDMVFSVLCEEWGLLVGLLVVLFYFLLWFRAVYVAMDAEDGFTSGLTLGIATLLLFEAMVVIGGSTGLIPLTGATLPFIAKGGSSILAKLMMVGMLLGLSARKTGLDRVWRSK